MRAACCSTTSPLRALADLHREPAHRRAGWQRDAKVSLAHPVLGVAEGQMQLGEGERIVDRRVGGERHQLQPRAVGRGQADGRRHGRHRRHDGGAAGVVAGDEGDETRTSERTKKPNLVVMQVPTTTARLESQERLPRLLRRRVGLRFR